MRQFFAQLKAKGVFFNFCILCEVLLGALGPKFHKQKRVIPNE